MSTLVLSGWTQPTDALAAIAPEAVQFDYSAYATPEASFAALAELGAFEDVIAWSMGGQMALRAVAAGVLKPRHLTLIAAPYQFVSDDKIKGMDPLTFEQFRTNYLADPARTKTRFHALVAKGDRDFKRIVHTLEHHPEVENTGRFLPWLDELGRYSLAEAGLAPTPPTLIIHGMNDAIVPHAQSELLARHLPTAQLNSWAEVGHAPHLHDPARLIAEIAAHRRAA